VEGKREMIKPNLIKELYGIEVVVDNVRGFPVVVLLRQDRKLGCRK